MKRYILLILSLISPSLVNAKPEGYSEPWQIGFQPPASPVMEKVIGFHDYLMVIITIITVFVMALLAYCIWKFRASKNPTPSKTTHNNLLELIWFAVPTLIVVAIAIPSIGLTRFIDKIPATQEAGKQYDSLTLKVVGHQFYWEYEYPESEVTFESYLIEDKDLTEGQIRLLEVDNRVVLPIDTNVKILLTSAPNGVIHNWAMPSLGLKLDAVPGRLNETWVRINRPGTYRGQCSELCGPGHGFMPIVIEAVSKSEFQRWLKEQG